MRISSRGVVLLEAAAVVAVALAVRLPGIGQDAGGDEIYHILAAKQYLADGTLGIHGAAPYVRAKLFTLLVAACMRLFGDSPEVARIPSLVAGCLTVLVAFLWIRSLGGRAGAWVSALLLALDPELVKLSQWARFYTLQHLTFLVGAIAVFSLSRGPWPLRRTAALAGSAVLSLFVALRLQIITEIGVAGILVFVCLAVGVPFVRRVRVSRHRWRIGYAVAALAALGALAIYRAGIIAEASRLVVEVDLWSASRAANWRFYHAMFQQSYPTLWTLFPLLLLVCALRQPRLALLCACVFGAAFVAHSVVALKHERYLTYAFPFFLVPCGVALAAAVPWLVERIAAIDLPFRLGQASRRRIAWAAVALAAGFALAANPAFARTVRLMRMDPTMRQPGMEHDGLSWRRAFDALRPIAASADIVVSADDLPTLYYLGRLDFVISATQLGLEHPTAEFTPDSATAVPLLTRPESLDLLMSCYTSGLIVGRAWTFDTSWAVPPETRVFVERRTTPVSLPGAWGVRAFVWNNPGARRDDHCPGRREGMR